MVQFSAHVSLHHTCMQLFVLNAMSEIWNPISCFARMTTNYKVHVGQVQFNLHVFILQKKKKKKSVPQSEFGVFIKKKKKNQNNYVLHSNHIQLCAFFLESQTYIPKRRSFYIHVGVNQWISLYFKNKHNKLNKRKNTFTAGSEECTCMGIFKTNIQLKQTFQKYSKYSNIQYKINPWYSLYYILYKIN